MNSIRSELSELIVGVYRSRDSTPAGLFLISKTIFYAFVVAVSAEAIATFFPLLAFAARGVAVFWIGTRLRALGNMMHECAHGTFVRCPSANTTLGHLLAAIDLSSFSEYREHHTTHHAYLGDPERDLDLRNRNFLLQPRGRFFSLLRILCASILLIPLWISLLRPVFWAKRAPLWSNLIRLFILIFVMIAALLPASQFYTVVYLLVPYLTTYQWMRIFSDCCDHLFITSNQNPLERSRNHLFRFSSLNLLLFPRNDGFHLLHHLFPSLPTQVYPQIHAKLMQHSWYRAQQHYLFDWKKSFPRGVLFFQGQSK